MALRVFRLLAAMTAVLLALASPSFSQSYPTRPITMIVPFAPGGPADVLGRLIGQKMSEDLGQQVIIDNRSGANTIVGAQFVAHAQPDGYTLLCSAATHVLAAQGYQGLTIVTVAADAGVAGAVQAVAQDPGAGRLPRLLAEAPIERAH